ncbi:centromere protein L isoform X2 [Cephus cinctus]|nr:centromere protein L isoform X2 [Cephus cinctus]
MASSTQNESFLATRTLLFTSRTSGIQAPRQQFNVGPRRSVLQSNSGDSDTDWSIASSELLSQTWTIWGVSPLFGFDKDNEIKLKLYAKKLREEIANNLTQENVTYEAKFTIIPNFSPNVINPFALKVEVNAKSVENPDVEKSIYKGIFMSWISGFDETNIRNSVTLPLLLCRGTQSGTRAVHIIIGHMFDCMIVALDASQDDLLWLLPIILTPASDEEETSKSSEVSLEYRIPGLPLTDTINVKFLLSTLVTIWKSVYEKRINELEIEADLIVYTEDVDKFHKILHSHMLSVAGLQLGLCSLHKISMKSLTITDNRMKIMSSETMNRVLSFLQESALEHLYPLHLNTPSRSTNSIAE